MATMRALTLSCEKFEKSEKNIGVSSVKTASRCQTTHEDVLISKLLLENIQQKQM